MLLMGIGIHQQFWGKNWGDKLRCTATKVIIFVLRFLVANMVDMIFDLVSVTSFIHFMRKVYKHT